MSKYLSYLLRHGEKEKGITIRSDGYVSVKSVLNLQKAKKMGITVMDIKAET